MVRKDIQIMVDPRGYLDRNEIERILSACERERDRVLFTLLARSGRRVSEVVRCLKPKHIDFKEYLVKYRILKRKRKHHILLPLDEETINLLKDYIKKEGIKNDDYIFPISRQRVDQIFKEVCEKIGIYNIGSNKRNKPHVHILRHSFAILATKNIKRPEDIVRVQNMMAHASLDSTIFYLQFNPTENRKLLEKMWSQ